jgi:toxin YoeB
LLGGAACAGMVALLGRNNQNSWEDYTSWQFENKKILKKINDLIKDIQRTPYEGLGNPEPLKYDLAGFWSRRIDREHRLVYQVIGTELLIYSCRYHYDK